LLSNDPLMFLAMAALGTALAWITYRAAIAMYIFYILFVKKDLE
jgi:hypothetical protein